MGKVYSRELRAQDDELRRFGVVSEVTRMKASSAWVPDLTSYDFLPEFLRWENITFKEVQRLFGVWRKMGCEVSLTKNQYEYLVRTGGLMDRNPHGQIEHPPLEDEDEDESPREPIMDEKEVGRLEILNQFGQFSVRQKQMSTLPKLGFGSKAKVNPGAKISILDFFCALTVVCKGTDEQKSGFLFSLFDFKRRRSLCRDECLALLQSCIRGFCIIKNIPVPDPEGLVWLCDEQLMGMIRKRHEDELNQKNEGLKDVPLYLKAQRAAAMEGGDELKCTMTDFVEWCKMDPCVVALFSSGSVVGNGSNSAFAERKREEQKKLLLRLAKIEGSLEILGEPRFPLDDLTALFEPKNLSRQTTTQHLQLGVQEQGDGSTKKQTSNQDEVEDPVIDEEEARRIEQSQHGRRRVAHFNEQIWIHREFPTIVPKTREKMVSDPKFLGLSVSDYSTMVQSNRDEWCMSTESLQIMDTLVERLCGTLMIPNCSIHWLVDLAQRCGVQDFDHAVSVEAEESQGSDVHDQNKEVPFSAMIHWVRTWSLSKNVLAKSSTGKFWAWARVVVPVAASLYHTLVERATSYFVFTLDRLTSNLWIGASSLYRAVQTEGKISIGLQHDDDWALSINASFNQFAQAISRSIESNEFPKRLYLLEQQENGDKTKRNKNGDDESDTPSISDEELEQLEFEISQIQECELLEKGAAFYSKSFQQITVNHRGSIPRSGIQKDGGVGTYVMFDLSSDIATTNPAINLAAFKLKCLFAHPYWKKLPWLLGVHVVEFSEFVGSAKMIRIVFFMDDSFSVQTTNKILEWFGNAETCFATVKMGSHVGQVFHNQWDGSLESLWHFAENEDDARELEKTHAQSQHNNNKDHELPKMSRRRGGINEKWKSALRLDATKAFSSSNEKSLDDDSESITEEERARRAYRKARKEVYNKRLTSYGKACVKRIVNEFDRDGDGGLNWLETNEMLRVLGNAERFSSEKEFASALIDDGVDIRPRMILTPEALENVYIASEPDMLANDLGKLGVSSSSLASCAFEFDLLVKGPIAGATCETHQNREVQASEKVPCGFVQHLQSLLYFKRGDTMLTKRLQHMWRNHASSSTVHLQYAHWVDLFHELDPFVKSLFSEDQYETLRSFLFKPAHARNFGATVQGIIHILIESLFLGNIGCLDDEIEEDDEEHKEIDDEENDSEPNSPPIDNDGNFNSLPDADFVQRGFLKLVHHLIRDMKGVISGLSVAHIRFANDKSVTFRCEGLNIFEWFIPSDLP